jgi:hypothetical protein
MLRSSFVACSVVFLTVACSSGESEPYPPPDGGASGLVTPTNAYWCTDPAPTGCAAVNVCGACVDKPRAELTRTTDTKEYAGSGAPDVSCFDQATPPTPIGTSKTVKMKGWVKIFANGPDSKNVKVEIYEEEVDSAGMPTGKLGKLVGTATSNASVAACPEPYDPTKFPCSKTEKKMKSGVESTRVLYPYELDVPVPTEKPLVAKTSESITDGGWFPLYDWNVAARNDKLTAAGEFEFDVRALGNDDYASILKAAYSRPPQGGESAIAGEVHDCGDVRVSNATVQVNPKSRLLMFYLSEVEDDPLPDSSRTATGKLGLYAVGGLKPGVSQVSAAGLLGGQVVTLGSYKISTFADSVSVYTFRGLRPWQIPKK